MKTLVEEPQQYHFLKGGGELGALIYAHDWSQTTIGSFAQWPQSLQTILGVMLRSQFPMLLWWGDELIQFYNDAYRPSLGKEGKHPKALGQRGAACWPEIWHIIHPLVDQVRTAGKSFFIEDQLVPIFRNGKIEDVYWTHSYSPVIGADGGVDGVLVVCNETTKRVTAINELKQTQKRLEQSEANLKNIILQVPVAMSILKGSDHVVEIANERMFEFWGKPASKVLSKPIFEALPEARGQGYEVLLKKVYTTGKPFTANGLPVTLPRDGVIQTVYVNFVYEAYREADGTVSGIMVVANEVTDQVLSRKKLEESEQRYKTLVTESTVGVALYRGPELRIQYVNEVMTRYWGKNMSVVGKLLAEAVPEIRDQPFIEILNRVYATGESYTGMAEKVMLPVEGKLNTFYFNYVYKPLRNSNGEIYGIHHMAMDVTDQVLARKQIEQNAANFRNIILHAPVAMCLLNGSLNTFTLVNQRMAELVGVHHSEIINRHLYEVLPSLKGEGLDILLQNVYLTGRNYSLNEHPVQMIRKGKFENVYVNFVCAPLKAPDGSVSGILVTASDVTEAVKARIKIEELVAERTSELAEMNKVLQRSNNELAQFAYIASHDLQEPVRKIYTFVEMLRKNLPEIDPRAKRFLDRIEYSAARMLALIRDVLAYSRLTGEALVFTKIDLNDVLRNVCRDFDLLIEEKHAEIDNNTLPVIDGIPVQINQLFSNLISNALKFSDKDTPPKIRIESSLLTKDEILKNPTLDPANTCYRISFIDNGIGFEKAHARQIFDIFQRLHGRNEYEGTGIGLAMCKKIVQNHNGDIYADAVVGRGAAFHVILPQHQFSARPTLWDTRADMIT